MPQAIAKQKRDWIDGLAKKRCRRFGEAQEKSPGWPLDTATTTLRSAAGTSLLLPTVGTIAQSSFWRRPV
jgi:hypothetical protein